MPADRNVTGLTARRGHVSHGPRWKKQMRPFAARASGHTNPKNRSQASLLDACRSECDWVDCKTRTRKPRSAMEETNEAVCRSCERAYESKKPFTGLSVRCLQIGM